MLVNFYIWCNVNLFLDLMVSKKNQEKLLIALMNRKITNG